MREFMDEEDLETAGPAELPELCRYIRTKTSFGNCVGYQPWQRGDSSTAAYWCLQTMAACGPDDTLVHPHTCCAGRSCFARRG
jgi:hypothetical protein